jgi:predicted RNA-binding Zn ribbon-like protein
MRRRKAHTGFEPVSPEVRLPEPLRRKLTELRLQSDVSYGVEACDRLNAKARDYEVLAASEVERAPLGETDEHVAAATAFAAVAIALREVADAFNQAA